MNGLSTHPAGMEPVADARTTSELDWLFHKKNGTAIEKEFLVALAATMNEGLSLRNPPDGTALPAGNTYLGQFIDHDLTFDKRLFGEQLRPTRPIENLRTPRFDLDCMYGRFPETDKALYEDDGIRLKVDSHDLRRLPDGTALIGDRRNDSNRILSQLHLGFAKFHNRVAGELAHASPKFEGVRNEVLRHYQWIALHDFLPKIVGQDLVNSILGPDPADAAEKVRPFAVRPEPNVPFEFSAAAFRFGHTMVRAAYNMNQSSGRIFTFDAANPRGNSAQDLRGFRPTPDRLAIDWRFFFPMPGGNPAMPQLARPINTLVSGPLFEMPIDVAQNDTTEGRRLPFRTLHRGEMDLKLASGQEVALALRKHPFTGAAEIKILGSEVKFKVSAGQFTQVGESTSNLGNTGIDIDTLEAKLQSDTPLWYYILKEAELEKTGRLGPVGGRLVAQVLIGLMLSDETSILRGTHDWKPRSGEFGCQENGKYTIADLLRYAGGN